MADNKVDLSWIFRTKFIAWMLTGMAGTFMLVYLVTAPLFIKPLYRSESLIYVPLTLFSKQYEQQGIGFGNNQEIDGHIQILKSTRIADSLDARFGLTELLNTGTGSPGSKTRLYEKIGSMVKIEKTRYNSVAVSVSHHDPDLAAGMANYIVRLGDIIKEDILFENRNSAYNFARELYERKKAEIHELEQQLSGNSNSIFLRQRPPGTIHLPGEEPSFTDRVRRRTIYEAELRELTALKNRYELMQKSMNTPLPRSYIISPAVPVSEPAWPPRILLSIAGSLAFIVLMIFIQIVKQDANNENPGQ